MEVESSTVKTGRMKCESQLQKLLAELLETEKKYVQDLQQVSQGQDLVLHHLCWELYQYILYWRKRCKLFWNQFLICIFAFQLFHVSLSSSSLVRC